MWPVIVKALHLLLVAFIVVVPFFGTRDLKLLHAIIVPFILLHWALNDSTCMLTQIEKALTDKPEDETFMGQLFGPVYKFETKGEENIFLWAAMVTVWLINIRSLK
jgi:hypothetical protein